MDQSKDSSDDRDLLQQLGEGGFSVPVPRSPYLEPEDSPFSVPANSRLRWYELILAEALLKPAEDDPQSDSFWARRGAIARVVCLPSFEPEWALWLRRDDKTVFSVSLTEAERSLWYSSLKDENPLLVPVVKRRRELPMELVSAICEVWRKVLFETRHPQTHFPGCDGVTYHFSHWAQETGTMAGKTWSPPEATPPGRLVAISHSLRRFLIEDELSIELVMERIRKQVASLSAQL
jgi:hypothetical protein